mgnify:CR=1 FL=1
MTKAKTPKAKLASAKTLAPMCDVKECFNCNGTGSLCNTCGEAEDACGCSNEDEYDDEDQDFVDCEECEGTGRICTVHSAVCGDLSTPPRCNVAKGGAK